MTRHCWISRRSLLSFAKRVSAPSYCLLLALLLPLLVPVMAGAQTLVSISVTPQVASVQVGATIAYTATGIYSDASTQDITSSVAWSSSNISSATIDGNGVATGVSANSSTQITATLGAISNSAKLMVWPVPSGGVVGTNGSDTLFFSGTEQQVTMTLTNPYSGTSVSLNDMYNVNIGDYDGMGGTDTLLMTNAGDLLVYDQGGQHTLTSVENILAGNGNDVVDLAGSSDSFTVNGGAADDILWGGSGNDAIQGTDGNDIIDPGPGNDVVDGGNGDDTITVEAGNKTVTGDAGNDTLIYSVDANNGYTTNFDGGTGTDTVELHVTSSEAAAFAVDITAAQAFIAANSDDTSSTGPSHTFSSFGLTFSNVETLKIVLEGGVSSPVTGITAAPDFGSVNVGQSSAASITTFFFSATSQVGSIGVLTQGASGKDFQAASGGTCMANTYNPGDSCTANVTFGPLAPGLRIGAVVLYDTSNPPNALATVPIYGTGVGPMVAFEPGIITTVAGNGTAGYSGDSGPATSAELWASRDVAVDGAGNLYIADVGNNRIRKLDAATGTITTVAGNGSCTVVFDYACYSGDGGPATDAELSAPWGVAVDGAGNLYIADFDIGRIRKVDAATGIITTVAGTVYGYGGDGGPATSAQFEEASAVAVDGAGTIYAVDYHNFRIRKVDATTGIITTVAGNGTGGYGGDGGPATSAEISAAEGIAVDGAGNLYIVDTYNQRIRKVDAVTGIITTVAGNGTAGYSGDDGPATSAEIWNPRGVAVDSAGNLYIGDSGTSRVRKVDAATGIITTVAGKGTGFSGDGGPATSAELYAPEGVAVDSAGNLYIPDNNRIRKVDVSDPPSLTFPDTNVGDVSAAQDVAIDNLGNAQLNITQISTAANFTLGGTDTSCADNGQLLDPAGSCILGIEFAPQSTGIINGSVVLTDNTLNTTAAMQSISLSGTGTGTPVLTQVNPNTGQQGEQSESVALTGQYTHFVQGTTTASFGTGITVASLTVNSPTSATATLNIDAAATAGARTVTLTTGAEVVTLANGFTVTAGTPVLTLVNPNTGQQGQQSESVALTGQYTHFVQGTTTASFGAGITVASLTVNSPTSATATLNIDAAATAGARTVILTTGAEVVTLSNGFTVTAGSPVIITVTPMSLDFGDLSLGDTKNMKLTVKNVSSSNMKITNISFNYGPGAGKDFGYTTQCGGTIKPGKSCTITVQMHAQDVGSGAAILNVFYNGVGSPVSVSLTGNVINPKANVNPSKVNFGKVTVGASSTSTVTLTSTGDTALEINSIALSGSSDFSESDDCPVGSSLAPKDSCTISLTFAPSAKKSRTGTLKIKDNASSSPQTVSLSGTGK